MVVCSAYIYSFVYVLEHKKNNSRLIFFNLIWNCISRKKIFMLKTRLKQQTDLDKYK